MKFNRLLLLGVFALSLIYMFKFTKMTSDLDKTIDTTNNNISVIDKHFMNHKNSKRIIQNPEPPTKLQPSVTENLDSIVSPSIQPTKLSDPKFNNWFKQESHSMKLANGNTSAFHELVNTAQNLNEKILTELKQVALTHNAAANDKILAVYMLTLAGETATKTIVDFIEAPLKYSEPTEPHTIDETRQMQERSLKIMAIDNLADRARTNTAALQQLKKLIVKISDSYVLRYLRKKISEIES